MKKWKLIVSMLVILITIPIGMVIYNTNMLKNCIGHDTTIKELAYGSEVVDLDSGFFQNRVVYVESFWWSRLSFRHKKYWIIGLYRCFEENGITIYDGYTGKKLAYCNKLFGIKIYKQGK